MDPKPYASMAACRAAQPAVDPEAALRLVVDNPEPAPEPEAAPGAMAVLGLTAFLASVVLAICRVFGAPLPVLVILGPMWLTALGMALWALGHAIPAAASDAREWVRRRGQ